MKLRSLATISFIEARRTTWADCENYGTAVEETNFTWECNGVGQCTAVCDEGLINVGQKKLKCKFKKKDSSFFVVPKNKEPYCQQCTPINELFSDELLHVSEVKEKPKGNQYTLRCGNGENILPLNEPCVMAECYCDKRQKRCYYRNKIRGDINDEIANYHCNADPLIDTHANSPSRLPEGLQCRPQQSIDGEFQRIVGGIPAIQHSWPWIVQMKYKGKFHCSGTIVGERMIVTAAHCCRLWHSIDDLSGIVAEHRNVQKLSDKVLVRNNTRASSLNKNSVMISSNFDNSYAIGFETTIIHPEYQNRRLKNDICLAIPKEPLVFQFRPEDPVVLAQPACLPPHDAEQLPHETVCWTAGWGRLKWKGETANVLQEVDVKMISDEVCELSGNRYIFDKENQKCAGHLEGGKDACQGDSGGPLICNEGGKPVLRGITSSGIRCAEENKPGIYTRIEKFTRWIEYYNTTPLPEIRRTMRELLSGRFNFATVNDVQKYIFDEVTAGRSID